MASSLHVHEVVAALRELGGSAPWREIEQLVTEKRGDSHAPYLDWNNFKMTMFQLVQQHCSGYAKFTGPVLFEKTSHGFRLAAQTEQAQERTRIPPEFVHPETVPSHRDYVTGAVRQVLVNAYERDPNARRECLAVHGICCAVCKMSFEAAYGTIGRGFIHVHHKRPLASRETYHLDPIEDLVPVCPNCHAMLHTSDPPLGVEELKAIMREATSEQS